jgi:superfamily II DNA or RNA helicase
MEFEQTVRFLEQTGKDHNTNIHFQTINKYRLFPEDEEEFNTFFVKDNQFINKTTFQRRILGLTSYYRGASEDSTDFPDLIPEKVITVEMSPHQFEIYQLARDEERKKERTSAMHGKSKKSKQDSQTSTLARIFSREFSNFVFPDNILRPFKAIRFITAAIQKEEEDEIKSKLAKGEISEEEEEKLKLKLTRPLLTKEQWKIQLKTALRKISDPSKPYLRSGKEGLDRYSPKMLKMLEEIQRSEKGLVLVYSAFRTVEGLEIFARVLEANGFKRYIAGDKMDQDENYKRFSFYSGQEDFKDREKIKKLFTSSDNKEGKLIRLLLTSSAGTEGLDLKNIRKVMIMEPYWHEIRIKQVVGRAVRKNSHIDLPKEDRNVQVFRYISSLSQKQKQESKEKISTDEYVLNIAGKKESLNNDVMIAVKEASVDCMLNQCVNGMKGKCFKLTGSKEGLAYLPDLTKDIVFGYEQTKTRTIKRKVVVAGLSSTNEIVYRKTKDGPWYLGNGDKYKGKPKLKKGKKFAYDPESKLLFDFDILKRTGNLSTVGKVNPQGLITI